MLVVTRRNALFSTPDLVFKLDINTRENHIKEVFYQPAIVISTISYFSVL